MVLNDEVSSLNVHVTIQSNGLHTYQFIYKGSIFDHENHIISTTRLKFTLGHIIIKNEEKKVLHSIIMGGLCIVYHTNTLTLVVPSEELSDIQVQITIQCNELHSYQYT